MVDLLNIFIQVGKIFCFKNFYIIFNNNFIQIQEKAFLSLDLHKLEKIADLVAKFFPKIFHTDLFKDFDTYD